MILAAAACRLHGIPYVLRGDAQPEPAAAGARRLARHLVAGTVVRCAAGALPIGERNAAFYRRYARVPLFPAPYSVDNQRFREAAEPPGPDGPGGWRHSGWIRGGRRSSSPAS